MGKRRIIAETGAGQHGVATATVCALLGFECVVYMGEEDMRRQRLNVFRMRLLGAQGGGRDQRQPHAQGRHQRGHARLGDQRRRHLLPAGLGAGRASLPDDGARFSEGDRRGGARARFWKPRAACRTPSSPASAAAATPSASSTPSSRMRAVRLVGVEAGGRGDGAGRARRALSRRRAGRAAGRLQLSCCRTTTGRSR